jgi:type I restriction enzyme S subunit
LRNLPPNWTLARIGDLITLNPKNDCDDSTEVGFVPLHRLGVRFQSHLTFEKRFWSMVKRGYTHFANGDVLLARITPSFENGKAGIARDLPNGFGAGSTEFFVCRPLPKSVVPEYLLAYFKTTHFLLSGKRVMGGASGHQRIPKEYLLNSEIPLAPFDEQKRIVDKLDSLLTMIDVCRDRLYKIPIILKCFRQSILVAVTSGEFVEENWLQTEGDTVRILLLSQIVEQLKTGPFGSVIHRSDYVHSGVPLINPMHINAGRITPSNDITISREKAEELREYQLKKGDIVIARRGVMGRCAVVGIREQGWLCGSGSMIIRTTDQILPEYLQLVLSSPNIVRDLESNAVGSTMVNLNQQIILNLKIPVPSIVKQELIINHVRVLFLLADRIEEYHQNAIKQVEQLTPTLLSKAFCGELVPQDPNDEPAAILLDRIHAERIANPSILKRDLITRKPKMTKMTNESVKKIIDELPSDAFSFEDLHKKLAGDYDSFKDILFELLDEDEPSIEQMFDKQAKAIHFIRKQK